MDLEAPMAGGADNPLAGGGRRQIRAADADRDGVAGVLGTAYSEGRLSREEYDARLEAALSARTYADLDQVVNDLPVRNQIRRTGEQGAGLALAGLVLGWGAVILGIVLIIAVVLAMSAGMHSTMRMP